MQSYVVLARKWRPAQFSDIVGQNHVVRTLSNSIRFQRIHQAYLFTGSRGIGKTSIARIFSKVIRCTHRFEENEILRSCDQCSSCTEIAAGTSVDVIEIDGASNNGVEAVREIRENAKYMPSSGNKKIYIIDEVHMLTTAAFNALLKTLEEPPAHVIFIFATTEPHNIPATILSRCQRFDYRRVTISQIQTRLQLVTQAEGIQTESGTLALIARAAEGSMRDALSLLDQVIAFSGSNITLRSVTESIGLIERQSLIEILSGIFSRKPLDVLRLIEQAYQQGHDLRVLTRNLIEFLHVTLLAKINSTCPTALELSDEQWNEIKSISTLRALEEIEVIFQVLHQGLEWIARSPQPKIVLDVLLIKCSTAEALIPIEAISQTEDTALKGEVEPMPKSDGAQNPVPTSSHSELQAGDYQPTNLDNRTWEGFIGHVRKSRPLLASILEHSSGAKLPSANHTADKNLFIRFSPEEAYFREQLQTRLYQEQLNHLLKEYFGSFIRLQIELKDRSEAQESLAAKKDREQKEHLESIKDRAQNHPIILEAKSLFGGELGPIDVQDLSPGQAQVPHADL